MRDPLLGIMQVIREAHNVTQGQVEDCMILARGTYRHIEKGRRPLPDARSGLAKWIQGFCNCVGATPEEREHVMKELSRNILQEFSILLEDLRHARETRD